MNKDTDEILEKVRDILDILSDVENSRQALDILTIAKILIDNKSYISLDMLKED